MKLIVTTLLAFLTVTCFAQQVKSADSLPPLKSNALQFTGVVVFSRIGFSPIPSFSFNKPIGMAFLSLAKGNFSYEPAVTLGLDGKPWFIDNWLKYRFVNTKKLRVSAGLDPNLIFMDESLPGKKTMTQACRQVITALFGDYTVLKNLSFQFTYWYDNGIDSGTLTGHFVDIKGVVSGIKPTKKTFVTLKPELFYFKNNGRVDGLFSSLSFFAGGNKYPLSLYAQVVQRMWADFNTPAFNWNAGVVYVF